MNKKLIDVNNDLERGTILRCAGITPYEEYVDFMIVEIINSESLKYGLMVVSGYKAGLNYVVFPETAISNKNYGLSSAWLKENWLEWGYIDCSLDNVYIINRNIPTSFEDY